MLPEVTWQTLIVVNEEEDKIVTAERPLLCRWGSERNEISLICLSEDNGVFLVLWSRRHWRGDAHVPTTACPEMIPYGGYHDIVLPETRDVEYDALMTTGVLSIHQFTDYYYYFSHRSGYKFIHRPLPFIPRRSNWGVGVVWRWWRWWWGL